MESDPILGRLLREFTGMREEMRAGFAAADEKISTFRGEMLSHIDAIYARFDRLEEEYQSLSAAVARIEAELKEDRRDRAEIRRDLELLKAEVADLQVRVADLEAAAKTT